MITNYTISIPTDIENLYLECYKERCINISKLFKVGDIFFFSTDWINNDFQKNLVNPIVLYITMLPNIFFSTNSFLKVLILENNIELTIYSEYDTISGLNPDTKILEKLNINLEKKNNVDDFKLANNNIIDKINSLRIRKDIWELIQINDAIEKTFSGFKAIRSILNIRNLNEANLEAIFIKTLLDDGFGIAYLPICAGDSNGAFIHYSKNNSIIYNNVLLDCGARNPYGYCADISRSYKISDNVLYEKVYDIVLKSKKACEKYIVTTLENGEIPSFNILNQVCINVYKELLHEILPSSIQIDQNIVNIFYTHYIGHHVGLIVHDVYSDKIIPGSVFTIEPGLYFNKENIKIDINPELFKIGGIRIEDMYYITPQMKLACLSSYI